MLLAAVAAGFLTSSCRLTVPATSAASTSDFAPGAVAELRDWPFGANERLIETDPARARSIAFLREVADDRVGVPADWRRHLDRARGAPLLDRLTVVNDLVNRVHYVPRATWLHPRVFFVEGGDCDCAAVAKYALLRQRDVSADDMRVVVAYWPSKRIHHAFLVVRGGAEKFDLYVLDIAHATVIAGLYAGQYTPLLSLNEKGIWRHAETSDAFTRHILNPEIRR